MAVDCLLSNAQSNVWNRSRKRKIPGAGAGTEFALMMKKTNWRQNYMKHYDRDGIEKLLIKLWDRPPTKDEVDLLYYGYELGVSMATIVDKGEQNGA